MINVEPLHRSVSYLWERGIWKGLAKPLAMSDLHITML